MARRTVVGIEGGSFLVNGRPTCAGRTWRGMRLEGLLMNARLVQGTFDDLNPDTRGRWAYPDGPWDADRNTDEFVAAMGAWRACGLDAFTINLQGGCPLGYCDAQPWRNSAFEADGTARADYFARLGRILDRADALGMVVILGLFYFGQDQRLAGEAAVRRAVDGTVDWLCDGGRANVLVEIGNEVDHPRYDHDVIGAARCDELIRRVQSRSTGRVGSPAGRLLASASTCGGRLPPENIAAAADFVLLHGNGVDRPDGIRDLVRRCRAMPACRGRPVLFNEDDHFGFDRSDNNMIAAVGERAGWGYFDYRMAGEGYDEGFQSVPVNWGISSARKRGFFGLLAEMTGSAGRT